MKDILIGLVIILVCFLVGDFIYTEKNVCTKSLAIGNGQEYKCGFIKKQFDINIDLFGRYW